MNLARWLLFCSAVAALSCTNTDAPPAETEVYVRVDTNVPGGPQSVLRGVRVYVSAPGEAPTSALSQDYQVPEGSGERNLFYVRVVPLRGDATRRVRFTVYGCSTVSCDPVSGAGTPITANSVTFGYLPNQTGWVRVFLADECRDVTCDETRETCNRDTGRCQPIPAVPTGCERLDDAGRAMDATCDVGALDAPPPMDVPVDLPSTEIDTDASCPGALLRCGDACVDVATSPAHCGRCGNACPTGANASPVCANGACGLGCNAGYGNCDRVPANGCEANLGADVRNCGACGLACASGQICTAGTCSVSCGSGTTNCSGVCRDLTSDNNNCGTCGRICPSGRICSSSVCMVTCAAGLSNCSGFCRDLASDESNCGSCGRACSGGQTCVGGVCVCAAGRTFCGGICVDAQTNSSHCGACGRACGAGQTCVGGVCRCASGTLCGAACVDTRTDRNNCGVCGAMCSTGQTCCAGVCLHTRDDRANCGACGNMCPMAAQRCVDSQCCVPEPPCPARCRGCAEPGACGDCLVCSDC